jgi:hypothetical protein
MQVLLRGVAYRLSENVSVPMAKFSNDGVNAYLTSANIK